MALIPKKTKFSLSFRNKTKTYKIKKHDLKRLAPEGQIKNPLICDFMVNLERRSGWSPKNGSHSILNLKAKPNDYLKGLLKSIHRRSGLSRPLTSPLDLGPDPWFCSKAPNPADLIRPLRSGPLRAKVTGTSAEGNKRGKRGRSEHGAKGASFGTQRKGRTSKSQDYKYSSFSNIRNNLTFALSSPEEARVNTKFNLKLEAPEQPSFIVHRGFPYQGYELKPTGSYTSPFYFSFDAKERPAQKDLTRYENTSPGMFFNTLKHPVKVLFKDQIKPTHISTKVNYNSAPSARQDPSSHLLFGSYGIAALSHATLRSKFLETLRLDVAKTLRKKGRVWIRICCDTPVTSRPVETRMGKGKGSIKHWEALVKPGNVIFEFSGLNQQTYVEIFNNFCNKSPLKLKKIGF